MKLTYCVIIVMCLVFVLSFRTMGKEKNEYYDSERQGVVLLAPAINSIYFIEGKFDNEEELLTFIKHNKMPIEIIGRLDVPMPLISRDAMKSFSKKLFLPGRVFDEEGEIKYTFVNVILRYRKLKDREDFNAYNAISNLSVFGPDTGSFVEIPCHYSCYTLMDVLPIKQNKDLLNKRRKK